MPQMAPMAWLLLNVLFYLIFIMIIMKLYFYSVSLPSKIGTHKESTLYLPWSW